MSPSHFRAAMNGQRWPPAIVLKYSGSTFGGSVPAVVFSKKLVRLLNGTYGGDAIFVFVVAICLTFRWSCRRAVYATSDESTMVVPWQEVCFGKTELWHGGWHSVRSARR